MKRLQLCFAFALALISLSSYGQKTITVVNSVRSDAPILVQDITSPKLNQVVVLQGDTAQIEASVITWFACNKDYTGLSDLVDSLKANFGYVYFGKEKYEVLNYENVDIVHNRQVRTKGAGPFFVEVFVKFEVGNSRVVKFLND